MLARRLIILFLIALAAAIFPGCSSPQIREKRAQRRAVLQQPKKMWLVSNGWHTSIAIRAEDATADLRRFAPDAKYLVIGWGGADFYMWKQMDNFFRRLRATFLPSASALHVIPVKTSLIKECPNSEIIEFEVTQQGIERLRKRLDRAFNRNPRGEPLVAGAGKLPDSKFFEGSEIYYLPKTCNMWAASLLNTAGVPIAVGAAIVADNLCWQGRKHGRLLAQRTALQDPL